MLNQATMIGRIKTIGQSIIILSVPYKEDTCDVPCEFTNSIPTNIKDGDIIGVRGMIKCTDGNLVIEVEKSAIIRNN